MRLFQNSEEVPTFASPSGQNLIANRMNIFFFSINIALRRSKLGFLRMPGTKECLSKKAKEDRDNINASNGTKYIFLFVSEEQRYSYLCEAFFKSIPFPL